MTDTSEFKYGFLVAQYNRYHRPCRGSTKDGGESFSQNITSGAKSEFLSGVKI